MPSFLRIVLAVVSGFVLGSVVNMALIMVSGKVIPPPAGADITTMEGLKASLGLFEAKHFLFPFLAHALGTLIGALVACWLAPSKEPLPAYVVGGLFLLGGVANAFILPAPAWFIATDLLLAYAPATWFAVTLAKRMSRSDTSVA
jgi:hypothetical protein